MKQSAVEFLSEQIRLTNIEGLRFQLWDAIEQAKEMEKQQIIDSYIKGNYKSNADMLWKKASAEKYYNETFKKK